MLSARCTVLQSSRKKSISVVGSDTDAMVWEKGALWRHVADLLVFADAEQGRWVRNETYHKAQKAIIRTGYVHRKCAVTPAVSHRRC